MSTTLRQMANHFNENNKRWEKYLKRVSEDNILKNISEVLKTYDYTSEMYAGWGIGTITENTVEIVGSVWLHIIGKAFEKMDFKVTDFARLSIKDYVDTALMMKAKDKGIIYNFTGSLAEDNLHVFLYIDGPRDTKPSTKKSATKTTSKKK